MKAKSGKKTKSLQSPKPGNKRKLKKALPGYPLYPASEDIYNRGKKVENLDFDEDDVDNDLDVPGAELDNRQERIGSEDEENNYYCIGVDNHNDLEEDHGD